MSSYWLSYSNLMVGFEHKVSHGLAMVSKTSAAHPLKTFGSSLLLMALFSLGFLGMTSESDGDKLWVDQASKCQVNQAWVSANYAAPPLPTSFIFYAQDGGNVLTKAAFDEIWTIVQEIEAIVVPDTEGVDSSYQDICVKDHLGACVGDGVLRFFSSQHAGYSTDVTDDAALLTALSATSYPDTGESVDRTKVFGSFRDGADGGVVSASAVKLALKVDDAEVRQAFEDAIREAYVEESSEAVSRTLAHVVMTVRLSSSLDDELSRNVVGDISLFVIAFNLMIIVATLILGNPRKLVKGHAMLAWVGALMVVFSIAAGYGLAGALGIPFTLLQQILPFILIGIGIDDAFVITHAFTETDPARPVEERVYEAVLRVGISVTMTSMTDVAAFLLGATSRLPAVQYFCIYASLSLFFIYFMSITFFCACLALDVRRQQDGRMDCGLCCIRRPMVEDGESLSEVDGISKRVSKRYAEFLVQNFAVKLVVMIVFFGVFGGCVVKVCMGIPTGLNLMDLAPDSSYLRDYYDAELAYWGILGTDQGIPLAMYFKDIDHSDGVVQASMGDAVEGLLALDSVDSSRGVSSWNLEFVRWARSHGRAEQGAFVTGSDFIPAVQDFLSMPQYGRFRNDIIFDSNSNPIRITTSRVWAFHIDMSDSDLQATALSEVEDYYESLTIRGPMISTVVYPYWDQYRIIVGELIQTFGLGLVAVFFVCIPVLIHPGSLGIVIAILAMIFTDLMVTVELWGLSINSVSTINLIMAIGLVVDYNAHIVHSFTLQDPRKSRDERVILVMQETGIPVCQGIISTFIAIVPLAGASSEVFRVFFKMFSGIIVVGAAHGLVLLPVLLSIGGPALQKVGSVRERSLNVAEQVNPKNVPETLVIGAEAGA